MLGEELLTKFDEKFTFCDHKSQTNLVEHFSGQSLLPSFEELQVAVARILT